MQVSVIQRPTAASWGFPQPPSITFTQNYQSWHILSTGFPMTKLKSISRIHKVLLQSKLQNPSATDFPSAKLFKDKPQQSATPATCGYRFYWLSHNYQITVHLQCKMKHLRHFIIYFQHLKYQMLRSAFTHLQSDQKTANTDVLKSDISKYLTHFLHLFSFQLFLSQTTDVSKLLFKNQDIYFELSIVWNELWFWDIESWLYLLGPELQRGWISFYRHEQTEFILLCIPYLFGCKTRVSPL